jgi:hypothetical protein
MTKLVQSAVIYRGPSLLDGNPIAVVAVLSGRNRKTGLMVQTYILRADIDPREANRTGADYSICGNCPLKGKPNPEKGKLAIGRGCYVNIAQGVLITYKHFAKGGYPTIQGHNAIAALGAGKMVRVGTYGDGAAVPSYVWESLLSQAKGWTGYSHQAETQGAAFNPAYFMQSVESLDQAKAAWALGRRTFRVVNSESEVVKGFEILCPASKGVQCTDCGLCQGNAIKAKSIVIEAHGAGINHARKVAA